jgi:hypothetical protein
VVVALMKGVLYREQDAALWPVLLQLAPRAASRRTWSVKRC